MTRFHLDDDPDVDYDDDDDEFEDGDGDEDDDEDKEDEGVDTETWQVSYRTRSTLNSGRRLTSGNNLPRLTRIWQLNQGWTDSAGPASRRLGSSSQAPITG